MKTVFVVLYGLLGIVPTDKELWVLMPDATAMHYADHSRGGHHYADIAVRSDTEKFALVRSLLGEEVVIGAGQGGKVTYSRGEDQLMFLRKIPVKAQVDPNCIIPGRIDACATEDGRPLLAGRVRLMGPVRLAPFFVDRSDPDLPVGDLVRHEAQSRAWTWAFREADRPRRFGTYEGAFGGAMVAVLMVPTESDGRGRFQLGEDSIQLEDVNKTTCGQYAGDLDMLDHEKAAIAANGCHLVWISNQPIPVDAQQDLPEERMHTELLFGLLKDRTQSRVVPYRIQQLYQGAGSPPSSVCIDGILEEKEVSIGSPSHR